MKRKKINEGDRIEVNVSPRERELLVDHTFADPVYAARLQAIPGKSGYVGAYTLDDLEDMLGYVAAEANHCEDRKLQKELYAFFDRLSELQRSYDDGNWQDSAV
jgi:hypothetical protein